MASDDGTCCVAAVAGDGLAGDASLSGDHPSNHKRGCDVVQGCRVDREEDNREEVDREEDHREEVDREEDHREEDHREEDHREEDHREEVDGEKVDGEEFDGQKVDSEEAGCRFEPVAEGRAAA